MAEKNSLPVQQENILLQSPRLLFVTILLGLLFLDPFHLGPLAGIDYRPVSHSIAPYNEVMGRWPADGENRLSSGKLEFSGQLFGPESIEFDPSGRGPYAGLADGRVVRWMGEAVGWETFALEEQCGRPLGLRFDKKTGDLYIADAYYGLMVVGPEGGLAVSLANTVEGKPILFANDLDIHKNGSLFFTDTSMRYTRRNHFLILLEGEKTGRLLRYDPLNMTTHVVLNGLAFPNGVQLSADQMVMRFWLEGSKSGQLEVFANLPGFPDNVRMNDKGQFWVAIDCCRTRSQEFLSWNPWLRSIYFKLPLNLNFLARRLGMKMYTVIALFDENSRVIEVLEDREGQVMKLVSEVKEVEGKLWIGTVAHNHIATLVYNKNP
ncbi:hypothetical protein M5K25_016276 [Dendrobium thyrsiflorum]|uniref:Strictosidine synthase conserved region domain-containing protein n=1 Tax=Dendrobium thyrsiflorum TaxID=117978 RepID=A0ABD0UR40_DENTH